MYVTPDKQFREKVSFLSENLLLWRCLNGLTTAEAAEVLDITTTQLLWSEEFNMMNTAVLDKVVKCSGINEELWIDKCFRDDILSLLGTLDGKEGYSQMFAMSLNCQRELEHGDMLGMKRSIWGGSKRRIELDEIMRTSLLYNWRVIRRALLNVNVEYYLLTVKKAGTFSS